MERKYLKKLIEWKEDDDRKPLLILGTRQPRLFTLEEWQFL